MEILSSFLYNSMAFVLILTVIVFAHEFGHYYIAKLCGVKIESFSIGFGKEIFGWNDKSGTRWKLSLLPMGGYVKMFGDVDPSSAPDSEKIKNFTTEERKVAFHTKPLYKKAAIVIAGPVANFIFAIMLLTFFFTCYGRPVTLPNVTDVIEGSAAQKAGIMAGDVIKKINGKEVETFDDVQMVIAINTGTPVDVVIERSGGMLDFVVTPEIVKRKDIFGNDSMMPLLGIRSNVMSHKDMNVADSFFYSFVETYRVSSSTLTAIGQMITGSRSATEISGPIGIAKYSGQSAKHGWEAVLWFMVVLSINLGLINLFPIPVLDGGHLLYYAIEAARGKPMADKVQQYGFKLGLTLIVALGVFAVINDIRKLEVF